MFKLHKTVVNEQHELIGFVISGKDREFGGMTNDTVQRVLSLDNLKAMRFKNNEVKLVGNSITEVGNFKINSLPMAMLVNNGLTDINSGIAILKRFVQNNENVGFDVQFSDGASFRVPYSALIMYSRWCKPVNFVVRNTADGKTFISGKPGVMKLEDIPVEYIGAAPTRKTLKSGAKQKEKTKVATGAQVGTGIDILDIYKWIIDNGGAYINLKGTKYVAKTVEHDKTAAEESVFAPLEVGELCTSQLQFNPVTLNVNAPFKVAGIVRVPFNGQQLPIVTFVDRTKSVFSGGKEYIKKFGIAIPEAKEDVLLQQFGKSLAFTKITDDNITKPLKQIIDSAGLVFYFVEARNIDMLSKSKFEKYAYSAARLTDLVIRLNDCKAISKCFSNRGKFMKTLKAELGESDAETIRGRQPFGIFASMSDADREIMKEMGFNIYTGGFTVNDYSKKKAPTSGEAPEEIYIEYMVDGRTFTNETGEKIIQAVQNGDKSKIGEQAFNDIVSVLMITDNRAKYKAALEVARKWEETQRKLERDLWCHNVVMLMLGNNRVIHTRDAAKWEYDEKASSRLKKGMVYACNDSSAAGLKCKFTGVQFAK